MVARKVQDLLSPGFVGSSAARQGAAIKKGKERAEGGGGRAYTRNRGETRVLGLDLKSRGPFAAQSPPGPSFSSRQKKVKHFSGERRRQRP